MHFIGISYTQLIFTKSILSVRRYFIYQQMLTECLLLVRNCSSCQGYKEQLFLTVSFSLCPKEFYWCTIMFILELIEQEFFFSNGKNLCLENGYKGIAK
jgi:hypothetical protein